MENHEYRILKMAWILYAYSSASHPISVQEIMDHLQAEGISSSRGDAYAGIKALMDAGFEISSRNENGEGYYLKTKNFTKAEVIILANAIHASHYISSAQSSTLVTKLLETLSSEDRKAFQKNVYLPNSRKTLNTFFVDNVEAVSEAVKKRRWIHFQYLHYDETGHQRPIRSEDGKIKDYRVLPKYIVYSDSRPYMLSVDGKHAGYGTYRIDRMKVTEVERKRAELPEEPAQDAYASTKGMLYMYSGEKEHITFRCRRSPSVIDAMFDTFGRDLSMRIENDEYAIVEVSAPEKGMLIFAQQYLDSIEILKPDSLRKEMQERIREAAVKYHNSGM